VIGARLGYSSRHATLGDDVQDTLDSIASIGKPIAEHCWRRHCTQQQAEIKLAARVAANPIIDYATGPPDAPRT